MVTGDYWASLVAQLVKNPPAIRETWGRSLGWENPQCSGLESSMGSQRVGHEGATFTFTASAVTFLLPTKERNVTEGKEGTWAWCDLGNISQPSELQFCP